MAECVDQPRADIVAASLQHCRPETKRHDLLQVRGVFGDELVLQVDRIGGNDDPLLILDCPVHCRQQVGDGLACPRSRFYHQVMAIVQSAGDCMGHLYLLWPVFKMSKAVGKEPINIQHGGDLIGIDRRRRVIGSECLAGGMGRLLTSLVEPCPAAPVVGRRSKSTLADGP